MTRQRKSVLSLLIVIATLLAALPANAYAYDPGSVSDPFLEMSLKTNSPSLTARSESGMTATDSRLETDFLSSDMSREKTDRYIVKYKNGGPSRVASGLGSRLSGSETLSETREGLIFQSVSKTELLILDEPAKPEDLALELQNMGLAESIEYIQPDFKLRLSDFSLGVTDGEGNSVPILSGDEDSNGEGSGSPDDSGAGSADENAESDSVTEPEESTAEEPEQEPEQEAPAPLLNVTVAVLDSGADTGHPALAEVIDGENAWNFPDNNGGVYSPDNPSDSAHGTHVAGIIAETAAETGADVSVMPLKVFKNGVAYTSDIIAAIEWAEARGASVVNCSFGSTSENRALREAMENSAMLFVCAAGNGRSDIAETPVYPACYDLSNVLSVASVNADGGFSYFSNYGEAVLDIAAEGRSVMSAIPGGGYGPMTGTSMAAANVTGAAVAVLSLCGGVSDVKKRLILTAERLDNLQNKVIGGRRLSVENAVSGEEQDDIITVEYEDDFDVHGYQRTAAENWELFTSNPTVQVAAGENFSLALKADGTVWSCGSNWYGQCGQGTYSDSAMLGQVMGLTDIVQIAAGENHAMALTVYGNVFTWGDNSYGQLGGEGSDMQSIPLQIFNLHSIEKISTEYDHCLAISDSTRMYDATVWEWGLNYHAYNTSYVPADHIYYPQPHRYSYVYEYDKAIDISAGYDRSIAVHEDGLIVDTGKLYIEESKGMFGYVDDEVDGIPYFADIASVYSGALDYKDSVSFAVTPDGDLWKWTYAEVDIMEYPMNVGEGDLFSHIASRVETPYQIDDIEDVKMVSIQSNLESAEAAKVYVLTTDGAVWALGDDDTASSANGLSNVSQIDSGGYHTLALLADGTVTGWGSNIYGQLDIVDQAERVFTPFEFSIESGKTYNISVNGENIESFVGKSITVRFDADGFDVLDLAAQTFAPNLTAGAVAGTPLTVVSFGGGEAVYESGRNIPSGKSWSGVVTVIRLRAKRSGTAELSVG